MPCPASDLKALLSKFIPLNRHLAETEDPVQRERGMASMRELLEELEVTLSAAELPADHLARIFALLMTLLAEAGPYRYETSRDQRLREEVLPAFKALRERARDVTRAFFQRPEFAPLAEDIRQEIFPLLDSFLEPDRFMPFRVIQAGKVAEHLHAFIERTEDEGLQELLYKLYAMKYPRFGTSGWRGRWKRDFTEGKTRYVVQAICDYLKAEKVPAHVGAEDRSGFPVVIGYDSRKYADQVARWVAEVCLANGFPVVLMARDTPTPALIYYSIDYLGSDQIAGIINCTASHNPFEWQGIKFNPRQGWPAPTSVTDFIAARANEHQLLGTEVPPTDLEQAEDEGRLTYADPITAYCDWLLAAGREDNRIPLDLERIRSYFADKLIVIDEMHGATRGYMSRILGRLGIPHTLIHGEVNRTLGELGYASPEEPHIRHLRERVVELGADLGLGMDTDGDRFGVIDSDGTYFIPNQVLPMLIKYLAVDRGLRGKVVVTQTGSPLNEIVARHAPRNGAFKPEPGVVPAYVDHPFYRRRIGEREDMVFDSVFVVPVGIKYIEEQRRTDNGYRPLKSLPHNWRDRLLIGGEESSGLTTRGHVPDKDGMWANLLIMDMIAYYSKPLRGIWRDLVRFDDCWESFGGRVDVDASDGAKEALINYYLDHFLGKEPGEATIAGQRIFYLGGIRYDLVEIMLGDGRSGRRNLLRIRASGTEPINRIYTECSDPVVRRELEAEVLAKLEEFSAQEIEAAYNPWRLVDILSLTKPTAKLWSVVRNKIVHEGWDPADLSARLRRRLSEVELRNREIVQAWAEGLSDEC